VYIRRLVVSSTLSEKPAMPKLEYPVIIEPLPQDDGGGFVALVPDLPGCMSDGETAQAALASVMDAVDAWIDEAKALDHRFLRRHATSSRRSNPTTNRLRCPRR
jgi:antitoxin HicB